MSYKWLFSSCKVLNVQVDRVVSPLTRPEHLGERSGYAKRACTFLLKSSGLGKDLEGANSVRILHFESTFYPKF